MYCKRVNVVWQERENKKVEYDIKDVKLDWIRIVNYDSLNCGLFVAYLICRTITREG